MMGQQQQQALEYHEPGILDMPEPDDEPVQPATNSLTDMWVMLGRVWCRMHMQRRHMLFPPNGAGGGPEVDGLKGKRMTVVVYDEGITDVINDDWRSCPMGGPVETLDRLFSVHLK